jgi:hypothetical protein
MNRRGLVLAGVGALVVVTVASVGIWYLFLDTPALTGSDLNATTPDPTVSTAPSEFTMSVEARTVSLADGTDVSNWSAGVLYNADASEVLAWRNETGSNSNTSIVRYQRYTENRTQIFTRTHTADSEAFTAGVESVHRDIDPETDTLHVDNETQTYRYDREAERSAFTIVGYPIPLFEFLHVIPFEYDGTTTVDGEQMERYVPVNGWVELPGSVDGEPDRYITNTSGALYVNRETGNVVSADVSFTSKRTDMRAGKWLSDDERRTQFTISVRNELDTDELAPDWANEAPFEES